MSSPAHIQLFGPPGEHISDINGRAVSIELFLGRHNLSAVDGTLIPVTWNGYVSSVGQYQGEINEKRRVLDLFLEEANRDERFDYYRTRFPELVLLWDLIFSMVRNPQREVLLQGGL